MSSGALASGRANVIVDLDRAPISVPSLQHDQPTFRAEPSLGFRPQWYYVVVVVHIPKPRTENESHEPSYNSNFTLVLYWDCATAAQNPAVMNEALPRYIRAFALRTGSDCH